MRRRERFSVVSVQVPAHAVSIRMEGGAIFAFEVAAVHLKFVTHPVVPAYEELASVLTMFEDADIWTKVSEDVSPKICEPNALLHNENHRSDDLLPQTPIFRNTWL